MTPFTQGGICVPLGEGGAYFLPALTSIERKEGYWRCVPPLLPTCLPGNKDGLTCLETVEAKNGLLCGSFSDFLWGLHFSFSPPWARNSQQRTYQGERGTWGPKTLWSVWLGLRQAGILCLPGKMSVYTSNQGSGWKSSRFGVRQECKKIYSNSAHQVIVWDNYLMLFWKAQLITVSGFWVFWFFLFSFPNLLESKKRNNYISWVGTRPLTNSLTPVSNL